MIYAMLRPAVARSTREAIARSILAHEDVGPFVQQGLIVHVREAQVGQAYYCIHCRDAVYPFRTSRPRGCVPSHDWYFQHRTENRCLNTDFGLGSSLINPPRQGCYIQLGCEISANDRRTAWHRTQCRAVDDGRSYCHLARNEQCIFPQLSL